jgi:protein gp37
MAFNTHIDWTQATWNPWHGCHKISPGCKFCYMFRDKARYGQDPNLVVRSKTKFNDPLSWPKEPRLCFTCSWSDWFIEEADAWRDEAYSVIRRTPWITYQILTKRIERATGRVPDPPLPNIWLGVSVEDRKHKDRIDKLRATPAAMRFLSIEPLLEDIGELDLREIDWVIVGGESGPEARPMVPGWVRSIRDQCQASKVPFFFKQWGEYTGSHILEPKHIRVDSGLGYKSAMIRVGKKNAGAVLDGREWKQFPQVRL